MSNNIPAWKRIGLKVQEELQNDPLALTEHLESGKVTNKQAKQLSKRKRATEVNADGTSEKKPPKRVKLPKSERGPAPEKDQLVYLKQYTDDLPNWKFSKQKQNWILKHIRFIEDKYEQYLVNYLVGLQGGSRDRLVEELKKVIESWNTTQKEHQKKALEPKDRVERAEEAQKEEEKEAAKKLNDITKGKKVKQQEKKLDEVESVDADYALRARKIVLVITEENITLEGIDNIQEDEEKEEKKEELDEKTEEQEVAETEQIEEKKQEETTKEVNEDAKEPKKEKKQKKDKKEKKSKKD